MNYFFIAIILLLTISIYNYEFYRRKRDSYLKAGKKWDRIVKELSKR